MLVVVRAWILLSALLVGAGWILSAFHELNRIGYGIIFALAASALFFCRGKVPWPSREGFRRAFHKFPRRFKRPAPFLFLVAAGLALIGGVLYVPTDGDSISYRIPRVLHWLGQERWHWIRTLDFRMDNAAPGFEWLSSPLILFTRTDRFLFLINWISFLMLPGLSFSVFTRLQVRPRVAWWWAWLISAGGCCFALQADTTQNDSFACIYALAAVDLALRAKENKSLNDLWLSLLAAALLTDAKQTDIPLAMLWLIAAWPSLLLLGRRPLATAVVLATGLLVSVLPVTIFNIRHVGTWTGIPADQILLGSVRLDSPFWGVLGNAFCLTAQNLKPPLFPWAEEWNAMMGNFLNTPFGAHFLSFERFGKMNFYVGSQTAGIGLGICVLILLSICWTHGKKRMGASVAIVKSDATLWLLRMMPWVLLLIFMAKVGAFENARQLAPYYVFFFPSLLVHSGHMELVWRIWWQRLGCLVVFVTVMLLIAAPYRPLFPAQTILGWLHDKRPDSKLVTSFLFLYSYRADVENSRIYFRKDLPPGSYEVGVADLNSYVEIGLWLPLGQRHVEGILVGDTPEQLRARGLRYVVVGDSFLKIKKETIGQWMSLQGGELTDQSTHQGRFGTAPGHIYLVHLNPSAFPLSPVKN
jgi:hypothetical protein